MAIPIRTQYAPGFQSETSFQQLANSIPQIVWVTSPNDGITFFNSRWYEYTGLPEGSVPEDRGASYVHPEDIEVLTKRWEAAFRKGETFELSYRLRRRDGVYRWHLGRMVPEKDKAGNVVCWYGTATDIQEQKELQSKFQRIVETTKVVAWETELDSESIAYISPQVVSILGYPLIEWYKPNFWSSKLHPEDRGNIQALCKEYIKTKRDFELEYRMLAAAGNVVWIKDVVSVRFSSEGKWMWSGYMFDITDLKSAEEKLKQNEERLRRVIRSRDEFLSMTSHELKTPVSSLMLQSQIRLMNFRRKDFSQFQEDKLGDLIRGDIRQFERLTRLIDDMLDISRIRTGKLSLRLDRVDLSELIQEVSDRYKEQLESAKIPFTLSLESGLVGKWDRFRLEQIYCNLLTNVMRYAPRSTLHVSVKRTGGKACLRVCDSGPGIAQKYQELIFNQFERLENDSPTSGMGLGLFIVRQIVEAHGGRIFVENSIPKGATFVVELPLAL
jgi:PAS domain S-box-containing protein